MRIIAQDDRILRVQRRAREIAEVAGRRWDALAKDDPSLEMARVHVDDLNVRFLSMAADLELQARAGLAVLAIDAALKRLAKVIGSGAPAALTRYAALAHQIKGACCWLEGIQNELSVIEARGLAADPILLKLGEASRALFDNGNANTFVAVVLANCVENALRFSLGHRMQAGNEGRSPLAEVNEERCAALGLAARTLGVAHVALYLFAAAFPEHAAKLDRESLAKLVEVTLTRRNRAQWEVAADIAKARWGIHVQADSLEREMKRRRTRWLGPGRPPESH